jgi:hypothetical protein
VLATCVGNFSRSPRSRVRVPRRRSTSFEACFPGNDMLIMSNERGQDDVPTCTCFVASGPVNAYDLIKLAHLETHCSISSRIFACVDVGWMFLKTSASFVNSNASSITLNDVRTLSSRRNWCTEVCQRTKKKIGECSISSNKARTRTSGILASSVHAKLAR